jgi:hypothetical protein
MKTMSRWDERWYLIIHRGIGRPRQFEGGYMDWKTAQDEAEQLWKDDPDITSIILVEARWDFAEREGGWNPVPDLRSRGGRARREGHQTIAEERGR